MLGENATIEVREGEGLNIEAVDAALKANVDGLSGTPSVTQYPSGNSNLTYAIDYPDRRLVLRRPPFGPLPKAGHNMFREYRIMRDLKPAFDQVPQTVFYTDDESIIGKEFYVMDRVDGPLIHKTIPPEWNWNADDTAQLGENFIDALAKLHTLDWKALGLEDFGRPEGYVERQILAGTNAGTRLGRTALPALTMSKNGSKTICPLSLAMLAFCTAITGSIMPF